MPQINPFPSIEAEQAQFEAVLRDLFAAIALPVLIKDANTLAADLDNTEGIAAAAYRQADAMLAARARTPKKD